MMTMMMIFDDNDDDGSHVMLRARYVWRLDCIHLDEIPENHFDQPSDNNYAIRKFWHLHQCFQFSAYSNTFIYNSIFCQCFQFIFPQYVFCVYECIHLYPKSSHRAADRWFRPISTSLLSSWYFEPKFWKGLSSSISKAIRSDKHQQGF